ncbi:hypothetical protein FZC68_03480 [Bacillus pumilus]|uniref:Uncharacterized protein n=1 Tax=Bacillus pumilus TaxID=1408 RepID=A0AAD0MKH9_BACPU|nr:hypothetical protein C5695_07350 [Bacillus pumilus]TYS26733.1 hypothetical protein FZC65_18925 [Bacillus pumilus]TYS39721.1 hypothetical protein FZC67_18870 [Bacillus pumilus]TYS45018.1 hypothetical protein FZC68_03480 [Bacillus pumilus]
MRSILIKFNLFTSKSFGVVPTVLGAGSLLVTLVYHVLFDNFRLLLNCYRIDMKQNTIETFSQYDKKKTHIEKNN